MMGNFRFAWEDLTFCECVLDFVSFYIFNLMRFSTTSTANKHVPQILNVNWCSVSSW